MGLLSQLEGGTASHSRRDRRAASRGPAALSPHFSLTSSAHLLLISTKDDLPPAFPAVRFGRSLCFPPACLSAKGHAMLTLHDGDHGIHRRQFLRIGGLGLGGLSLSSLLAAKAAAEPGSNLLTGKSVIFLFQQGGPSQHETFDPKMDAPVETRTVTGSVQTS